MQAIKFTLSGRSAFFKKPDVNAYGYFTYGQIHKISLIGMFGAILGYSGYGQKKWTVIKKGQLVEEYPEFYEKLKDLKVSIVPRNENGYIPKKVQIFNNSVGYASQHQGGNLIVKEQWLESPVWDIYILLDCKEAQRLSEFLQAQRCIYTPYLGKNDHLANISDVVVVDITDYSLTETQISCMYPKSMGKICLPDDEDDMMPFKYEENLPVRLNGYTNFYECDKFCYTNMAIDVKEGKLYKEGTRVLTFY